jgi:F-type H+-transporting ATPase subunit epsilon
MADSMTLRVLTPERIVLDTSAASVRFPGVDGSIGVLPRHAPMVAALDAGELYYRHEGKEEHFFVSGGFAEVRQNTVRIVTDACERPTEIDVERAIKAGERARERLRSGKVDGADSLDVVRAEAALRRALSDNWWPETN